MENTQNNDLENRRFVLPMLPISMGITFNGLNAILEVQKIINQHDKRCS